MNKLRKVVVAVTLFFILPASVLWLVFIVLDKNTDWLDRVAHSLKRNLSPALVFRVNEVIQAMKKPYSTEDLDSEDVEESIPLIKAKSENETEDGSVIMEDFLSDKKEEDPSQGDINAISLEFSDTHFSKQEILTDKLNRLPEEFKIQSDLISRVGFWFDIYAKYSSRFSIIHDEDQPWIIYAVVDAREIYTQPGSKVTQSANEQRLITKERTKVVALLKSIANQKSSTPQLDSHVLSYLKSHPKGLKAGAKSAIKNIRIQRGQKNFFKAGLVQGAKYLHEMESIFAKSNLPTELVRLPLVESSFNEKAVSKVGASGIWQFMPKVGKHYLKMSEPFDERNSPIKATEAAARLIRSNYSALGEWPLAITAYNHGASGLLKAVKKLSTKDLHEIILRYKSPSFSFASKNFYSEFMAALYAERYQEEIFGQMPKVPPLAEDRVTLKKSLHLRDLSEIAGVTMEEIKLHNPDIKAKGLKENAKLPQGYKIHLPLGSGPGLELYFQRD